MAEQNHRLFEIRGTIACRYSQGTSYHQDIISSNILISFFLLCQLKTSLQWGVKIS